MEKQEGIIFKKVKINGNKREIKEKFKKKKKN